MQGLQRQRLQNPQNLLHQFCTSCRIFCAAGLQPAAQDKKAERKNSALRKKEIASYRRNR